MNKSFAVQFFIMGLLMAGILVMGCSSSDSSGSQSPSATAAVTSSAASSGALFSAGDIVKNPKSSSNSGLLIIGYDAGSDMYERAYVYPNSDGTWGYRMDTKTEKISRSTIEKVYTQKVTNKAVSAVPVKTPTPAVTATEVYTTVKTTVATVAETTTATTGLPKIMGIPDPDEGKTGTTVEIKELKGVNFVSGATVALALSGSPNITATNVKVQSSNLITCTFAIPSNATLGAWDMVITNPDGQYHQYRSIFNIRKGSATTTTVTTATTTAAGGQSITAVSPSSVVVGSADSSIELQITGTNLGAASNVKLISSSKTIPAVSYYASSPTEAKVRFNIPASSIGTYTVSLVDSSGSVLSSLSNGLYIS